MQTIPASARTRSSPAFAASPIANVGFKGHWQVYGSRAAFDLKFLHGVRQALWGLQIGGTSMEWRAEAAPDKKRPNSLRHVHAQGGYSAHHQGDRRRSRGEP